MKEPKDRISKVLALGDSEKIYTYKEITQILGLNDNEQALSQLNSGVIFDFLNPTKEMIKIEDIAHSLCALARFNGHLDYQGWTNLHHSVLVAELVEYMGYPEHYREGLMHDASEAYTGDLLGPLKKLKLLRYVYKSIERPIEQLIADKFNLEYPWPKVIKKADIMAQAIEAIMFKKNPPDFLVPEDFIMSREFELMVEKIKNMGPQDFIEKLEQTRQFKI